MKFLIALFACLAVANASGLIGGYGLAPAGIVTTGVTTGYLGTPLVTGYNNGLIGSRLIGGPALVSGPGLYGGPGLVSSSGLIAGPGLISGPGLIAGPGLITNRGLIGGKIYG